MLLSETVHPDFIEEFRLVWNNIWKGSIEPYYEYKIFHKSGDIRWVRQRSFLIHDDSGAVTAVEGYIADVTYLKRSEEDLQKLILRLKRSNEDLDEFATAASHDLQEPLMVISNFSQILMNDYLDRLDNKGKDFLRYIFDASNRMRGLLNGLLAYSRITAGRYYRTIVPVKSVVSSALENLDISLKEHMADIILELPDDIIVCDPYQIARAIQNIVSNSLKFSDKKMPLIKIKAVLREDIWTFTIEDNGIGIDKENVDKIFQIFYRGDSEYSGTGIGLAMAKKIIARHGGSITVSSVKGEGSTFTFTLPRTTEPI
jgi:signal transduction histidine kinase